MTTSRVGRGGIRPLRAIDVIAHYAVPGRASGGEYRTRRCPACGEHKSDWTTINLASGAWYHHGASCHGGIRSLVVGYGGLGARTSVRKVRSAEATIASRAAIGRALRGARGPDATPAEAVERRRKAQIAAASTWELAGRRSARGEAYLGRRGIEPGELIARGLVRFDGHGNPVVAIHDFNTGVVISTATRMIGVTGDRKVMVTRGGTTLGTMIGRVDELRRTGPDLAVIVEGVTDGLTAAVLWPEGVVLAAHSAGRLARVPAAAAARLREIDGVLLIVPDRGNAGVNAAVKAVDAAEAAGMKLDRDVHLVDLGVHQDLTAAVAAGWKWAWPT